MTALICDRNCENCGYPDCISDETTEEEILRSEALDREILKERHKERLRSVGQEATTWLREVVRGWRRANRLSTYDAAELIGIRERSVRRIEAGGAVSAEECKKVIRNIRQAPIARYADLYTPRYLRKRLLESKAKTEFRKALAETFLSCWAALCRTCGKSGSACTGCKWKMK